MEDDFYRDRLARRFGLEVLIPDPPQRDEIHRVIYHELCHGQVLDSSRRFYVETIHSLIDRGAQGIILGCTEIPMLVNQDHVPVPVFDTTELHAVAAVQRALAHMLPDARQEKPDDKR